VKVIDISEDTTTKANGMPTAITHFHYYSVSSRVAQIVTAARRDL